MQALRLWGSRLGLFVTSVTLGAFGYGCEYTDPIVPVVLTPPSFLKTSSPETTRPTSFTFVPFESQRFNTVMEVGVGVDPDPTVTLDRCGCVSADYAMILQWMAVTIDPRMGRSHLDHDADAAGVNRFLSEIGALDAQAASQCGNFYEDFLALDRWGQEVNLSSQTLFLEVFGLRINSFPFNEDTRPLLIAHLTSGQPALFSFFNTEIFSEADLNNDGSISADPFVHTVVASGYDAVNDEIWYSDPGLTLFELQDKLEEVWGIGPEETGKLFTEEDFLLVPPTKRMKTEDEANRSIDFALVTYESSTIALSLQDIQIRSYSPVELLVTDPDGRRIGHQQGGTSVVEAPGAYFTQGYDRLGDPQPEDDPAKIVRFTDPEAGDYQVDIIGTGEGPYTVVTSLGGVLHSGNASPGSVHQVAFSLPFPPTVVTLDVASAGSDGATVVGSANPGLGETTAWFEWGADPSLNTFSTTPSKNLGVANRPRGFSHVLTGIGLGQTVYYRAVALNSAATERGTIKSFTTATSTLPTVDFGNVTNIGHDRATLIATVSANGAATTVVFQYANRRDAGQNTFSVGPTIELAPEVVDAPVSLEVTGLQCTEPGPEQPGRYLWGIMAENANGSAGLSISGQFFTLDCQTRPNRSPVADAGGPYLGVEGAPVMFDAVGSEDPDGDPLVFFGISRDLRQR